jgi:hypothetical protein
MQVRQHNFMPKSNGTEGARGPEEIRFHGRPYRRAQEEIQLVLHRQEVYELTQLLQYLAVESDVYDRVSLAVRLNERILESAREHGY